MGWDNVNVLYSDITADVLHDRYTSWVTDWLIRWLSDTATNGLVDLLLLSTGLTHYLGQDKDAKEMKSESKDFVLVAGNE